MYVHDDHNNAGFVMSACWRDGTMYTLLSCSVFLKYGIMISDLQRVTKMVIAQFCLHYFYITLSPGNVLV